MLTDEQIREIVHFDWFNRMGGRYDGRRYGTYTGSGVPDFTQSWAPVEHPSAGPDGRPPTRKCLRYNYIVPKERPKDGGRPDVFVVHVAVRLNRSYTPVVKDVVWTDIETGSIEARDIGYHGIAGWQVYWERKDWDSKAVNAWICPKCGGVWRERYRRRGIMTFPWHETVNPDALKGTRYEWCQYDGGHGLVDWLSLYRAEPGIEFLAKLGLRDICTPTVAKALHDGRIRAYLRDHLDELKHAKSCHSRAFVWAARRGLPVREGVEHYRFVESVRIHMNYGDRLRFDYERVRKMLPKWKAGPDEYVRYLHLCADAGLDMKCEGVLYPPVGRGGTSFHARMENVEREVARRERAKLRRARREFAEKMATRSREIDDFQQSIDRTKVVDLGRGVRVLLAKTQDELRVEGKRMGNCVGCGLYGQGIANGDTIILMFRKNGWPYCDAEIDRENWSVRQVYIAHNKPAPAEYRDAAERIARHLKKFVARRTRAEKREMAAKAGRKVA